MTSKMTMQKMIPKSEYVTGSNKSN